MSIVFLVMYDVELCWIFSPDGKFQPTLILIEERRGGRAADALKGIRRGGNAVGDERGEWKSH